ncbi:MAG: threonine aldolase family protein [Chitinophagales bacterium]
MIVDLRSDTVTKPTTEMHAAMFAAKVGDDVFGEDPTVNELEAKTAAMFGKEAAIFCPSGTMCNQIALKVHTQPLEQVITHELSHLYQYEVGGHAFHSGVSLKMMQGNNGILTADFVTNNVNADYDWLPVTSLVWLENTCNKGGGIYYTMAQLEEIKAAAKAQNLPIHIDGARIFNALVASGISAMEMGQVFDSLSFCLSKGLGAPVGSMLVGDKAFIRQARRVRKVMGGGMRQAGYLAAAGLYALENNVERLAEDHQAVQTLLEVLQTQPYVEQVLPVHTNILIFELKEAVDTQEFVAKWAEKGILVIPMGPKLVRIVTHLDFTKEMLEYTLGVIADG